VGLTTLYLKNKLVTKASKEPLTRTDSMDKRPKLWNILERWDGVMWTGFIWLRIGTFGFNEMLGNYRVS
jgi:hypothetical protein